MALPERDYLACFEDWKKRLHKCIFSGGNYFEVDEINLEEKIIIFHFENRFTLLFTHSSTKNFSLCILVVLLMPASFVARIMAGRGFVEEGWGLGQERSPI